MTTLTSSPMTDDALIDWLSSGAKVERTPDELKAQRTADFVLRFVEALHPLTDLGPTEELHQAGVAARVKAVHADLNPLGEEEYSRVWSELSAPHRAAIKKYLKQ